LDRHTFKLWSGRGCVCCIIHAILKAKGGYAMTVKEFIEMLENLDQDKKIEFSNQYFLSREKEPEIEKDETEDVYVLYT
jgi:hypothetical protein